MITVISTGKRFGVSPPCDIHVPAWDWPAPPPALRQLDGRAGPVAKAVLCTNPIVLDQLKTVANYARSLAEHQDEVTVVVECAEGIHRSVAGAEFIEDVLGYDGVDVRTIHRDLGRRSS